MTTSRTRPSGLRGLILAGAGAGISTLQSCILGAMGIAAYGLQESANNRAMKEANEARIRADRENAVTIANGQIDAARIRADGEGDNQNNYVGPTWETFTCSEFKDFNKDGIVDLDREIVNKGKTEFYVGDTVTFVIRLLNCGDRTLKFFRQETVEGELVENDKAIIPNNRCFRLYSSVLGMPGDFHAYITLDDARIGDYRISVRGDPSAVAKK